MSLNWVMLSEDKKRFTPLPGEQQLYTSSPRTTLSLRAIPGFPGRESFSIDCNAGTLYLTNRRVVFLPTTSTSTFQSFACPILNLHDTHVAVPWFGANTWTALVQPVPGGNLPPRDASSSSFTNNSATGNSSVGAIELKISFKDGGAFDFHSRFERIKERMAQVVEVARDTGVVSGTGSTAALNNVHLDELPAYEATAPTSLPSAPPRPASPAITASAPASVQTPSDAPPGYEESQARR